jgi:HAD superfamily hydrolase (TIGR01509 family)
MENKKGAIFDLDGTLLDSMQMWMEIDIRFLKEHGICATEDYSQTVKTLGYRKAAEYTIERYHMPLSVDEVVSRWGAMANEEYATRIRLKEGAEEYIRRLHKNGRKLAIATALTLSSVEFALRNNGIFELFESVTMLHEVSRGKGFPDIYLLAAERLSLKPDECVVYEDILEGIFGAKAGGFLVCGVYDDSSMHDWSQIQSIADHAITNWHELL